jgi:iron-sulfur cluster protein
VASEDRAAHIRRVLAAEGDAVAANTQVFNEGRYESTARLDDYEELKQRAREIKADAIERLPELTARLADAVEANGGTLYVADDAADAVDYVREVCASADAERVVKSKSMTTEEVDLNEGLEAAGYDVLETDLGEWVLQVADEAPSHIVAPAIHKSREDIAALFESVFDPDEELETAAELTAFARERLGEQIEGADVGVTGANFVTADSGSIALVTSEGNARKSVTVPDTHVAVAGIEKVVPSVEDLAPFVELIGRSGTGQDITAYVSLLTPPTPTPTIDFDADATGEGERDFHLVLLDNGRRAMREDETLRETLYCIRCSACSNVCANFQQVGGHVFGGETYSGGIATGWEAGIEGLDTAASFNDLCTGCSRCVDACPVGIDIPWINTVVRDRINRGADPDAFDHLVDGLSPDAESGGPSLSKRLFGNADALFALGSATAPVSNWLASARPVRAALERVAGLDRRRDLPRFSRETFRDWFAARGGSAVSERAARREAVVYADTYTDHVHVDRGKAAVRALEALDVRVRVPDVPESGRAPLSQGMVSTAERRAKAVAAALAPHLDAGRDVVVVEPSDLAMFRSDYERLLAPEMASRVADASYDVFEYLYGLVENGASLGSLRDGAGSLALHTHCQQRTLGLATYTEAVLERLGYDVTTSDVECCGMAGSFGYKLDYYDLSAAVGADLAEQFEGEPRVVASGTSCVEQLDGLLDPPIRHPIEVVAPASDAFLHY